MDEITKNENAMEEKQSITPPAKSMTTMYVVHLGLIFSNLAIVCVAIGLVSFFSMMLQILVFLILFCAILVTLGLIFYFVPNYFDLVKNSASFLEAITDFAVKIIPYILPIGIVCAIISIILLSFDKYNSHAGRIAFSSVILGMAVLLLISVAMGVIL